MWLSFFLTLVSQWMIFYKAITTKYFWTELVCVVLLAAMTPAFTQLVIRLGRGGFEFVKKRLSKTEPTQSLS